MLPSNFLLALAVIVNDFSSHLTLAHQYQKQFTLTSILLICPPPSVLFSPQSFLSTLCLRFYQHICSDLHCFHSLSAVESSSSSSIPIFTSFRVSFSLILLKLGIPSCTRNACPNRIIFLELNLREVDVFVVVERLRLAQHRVQHLLVTLIRTSSLLLPHNHSSRLCPTDLRSVNLRAFLPRTQPQHSLLKTGLRCRLEVRVILLLLISPRHFLPVLRQATRSAISIPHKARPKVISRAFRAVFSTCLLKIITTRVSTGTRR